ncbi:MAG: gamma carbonic anhydrase family protein [Bacteroidetes bacterium 4572_117]|nr:MAG: gamma carbonic anhydrase family protein [Bacteroidetes bacterium 4572_117]
MALIKSVRGFDPDIPSNCYIAENATIIGNVTIGNNCSIWFNAVLRGDVHYIKIGDNVNVQDGAIIHATYEKCPTNIGDNVSIAHGAIIHGCTINDNVLIGMGAIVMDNAIVESNSIVAAGAVVTQGTHIKSGSVFGGSPAKLIKEISPELLEGQINRIATNYAMYSGWYK